MKVKDLYDPAFFMVRSLPPQDREPTQQAAAPAPKPAERKFVMQQDFSPDLQTAEQIVATWRDVMGMELNVDTVRAHLETLKRWHSRLEHRK